MNVPSVIESPLVEGADARLVRMIPSERIIRKYHDLYSINVSSYFEGINEVSIYECNRTGYRFYFPFQLAGREDLYRQLEATPDGKYKADKWEYRKALALIGCSGRLLDVGCGKGAFVKLAGKAGFEAHGVELNSASAAEARKSGLNVTSETLSQHAKTNRCRYDVVCSFQVLEHVPNARAFIRDCISALRVNGMLIFDVPNNDGFVGADDNAVLNMPPHHMGLWTKKSLSSIASIFNLNLKWLEYEPLAEIDWYAAVMERRYISNKTVLSMYYSTGLSRWYRKWIETKANCIPGHTLLAVYEKKSAV